MPHDPFASADGVGEQPDRWIIAHATTNHSDGTLPGDNPLLAVRCDEKTARDLAEALGQAVPQARGSFRSTYAQRWTNCSAVEQAAIPQLLSRYASASKKLRQDSIPCSGGSEADAASRSVAAERSGLKPTLLNWHLTLRELAELAKVIRIMPLFDELEPLLPQAFGEAPDGAKFVLPDRLRLHTNLATTVHKFIKRAGVKPWPRVFHNLRASRQTELEDAVGLKAACEWLGNDESTARRHYLRVTDAHFDRVLSPCEKSGARSGAATAGRWSHGLAARRASPSKTPEKAGSREGVRTDATDDDALANPELAPKGLESRSGSRLETRESAGRRTRMRTTRRR